MKFRTVYIPAAKDDLKKAINYYKNISSKLAKDFIARIVEGKNYITQNPYGDDINYKEIRMHTIRQFPYHIHYLILENINQILILAIEFSKRENLDFSTR
ncbi:type II toxin-antitoxin system RelE/ParE family toxin [Flavobacterium poyangense]|uniref:type II toxin-antitoxin system RelE/ParE family toxin n=1 Tax=Flavobacterium poyangense TaxID=2204302 RepID=UPI001423E3FD|nr:type II toxin-antitoxin system RelE/ParE family toxin [Flavobacterium sp. JXAS1]